VPVCSYIILPREGAAESLRASLETLDGCEVVPSTNSDILLLVTDTPSLEADTRLRQTIEDLEDLQLMVLSFGEIDPDTQDPDPLSHSRRRLRVLDADTRSQSGAPR
jgi:nitrate reductase NapAB chaperone NapD